MVERSPTQEEFYANFSAAIESVDFVNHLESVTEVDSVYCSDDIQQFSKMALVEMVVGCNLVDNDLPAVAQAFVDTYNELQEHLCDPAFRVLESAEVTTRGQPTIDGTIPLEMLVTGYCRGCDPLLGIDIYDLPPPTTTTPITLDAGGRFLSSRSHPPRRLEDTCYCSAQAVPDRAPSEAEFIQAFQASVESMQGTFSCVESVAECQFGSFFETAILVAFDNVTFADDFQGEMEEAFLKTLNQFYETNDSICNPDFRQIQSV
jgi:hypothetical protein